MRLLVIEDDEPLAHVLIRFLREESYAVDHACDGQEAEWMTFENPYDVIIIDMMLPRKSGLEVIKALRSGNISSPILVLTAKDSKKDLVEALDHGADDYLTKPYDLEEISARIRALLRRKEKFVQSEINIGPIKIAPSRREVKINGNNVGLTVKEYGLLEYFARNAGTVLTRTQLSEHVWDINFEPTSNVVDVYVGYLRTKIDKFLGFPIIKTVRGYGYMLDMPEKVTKDQIA
jgi:DNA-binding response OmpR family regulator